MSSFSAELSLFAYAEKNNDFTFDVLANNKEDNIPSTVTVDWSFEIVDVGLNAVRKTMVSPLEMPPCIPPLRFVFVL